MRMPAPETLFQGRREVPNTPLGNLFAPRQATKQISGSLAKFCRAQAQMLGPECPIRQAGESCAAYSTWLLVCYHQLYPVCVGSCQYARATTPFRAADIRTYIANCVRPLPEDLAVWFGDLSERYQHEWWHVLRRVRRWGGPSLNPAIIPWVEVVLKLRLGWSLWVEVQRIA